MADVPVQLLVAAFRDEKSAKAALKTLKQAQKEKLIRIEDAVVLRKDEKGKLYIKETADMGGVGGAAIGLIAGPALLVPAVVGAMVGGLTAKLRDSGFSDARLEALGEGLAPGSSAIIAIVAHTWVEQVEQAMTEAGADMLTASISADIAEQLAAGHEVAYTAISSQAGFAAARVAGGEDEVEGGQILVDDSGPYGGRFVATKEGFAVLAMEADEEGITVAGMAAVEEETTNEEKQPPEI